MIHVFPSDLFPDLLQRFLTEQRDSQQNIGRTQFGGKIIFQQIGLAGAPFSAEEQGSKGIFTPSVPGDFF